MQFFQISENDLIKSRIYLHLVDGTDGITPATGEAGGKGKLSINGGAPADTVNGLVAVDASNQPGTYYIQLTPRELATPGFITVRYKSSNTAEFVVVAQVVAFDPYSKRYGDESLSVVAPDIDYKRIKKIVEETIKGIPEPEKPEKVDFKPVLKAIEAVKGSIPMPDKVDFSSVLKEIKSLESTIKKIKIPETDLSSVESKLDKQYERIELIDLDALHDQVETVEGLIERVKQFIQSDVDQIKSDIKELSDKMENMPYVVLEKREPKKASSVLEEYLKMKQ